jgi:hypothetical protein
MRLPTLMSLALAAFVSGAVPALAAPPEAPPAAERTQAAATPAPNPPQTARAGERRRRPSYAACNRESHRRNLYGGPRRRFLIRCRLGYDRRPGPTAPARRP